jgi:Trk K+ transport system NAD-binding subunit
VYNIVIGSNSYGEMIIDLLIEKNKLVFAMDKKENLQRINQKKIVKLEVNTDNAKLVQSSIGNQQVESIYIVTDDDKLNLMLGEQLAHYDNTYVFLLDEKLTVVADGNYKVICPNLLIKEFVMREIK